MPELSHMGIKKVEMRKVTKQIQSYRCATPSHPLPVCLLENVGKHFKLKFNWIKKIQKLWVKLKLFMSEH